MRTLPRRQVLEIAALAALGACSRQQGSPSSIAATSTLPSAEPVSAMLLEDALGSRRSVRSFSDRPVTPATVARLLWASQGQTAPWGGRTAPSAGALYPLELYVATVDRLSRYLPADGTTEVIATEDRRLPIATATGAQSATTQAPVLFVITGVAARSAEKYGDRAERYVQLEAGHACQNLLLEATALGLGAVPIGAFDDDLVRVAIDAGEDELPLYVVPVGHPAPDG
jgi:SagB-type dehydrogenase family enzyme